MVLASSSRPKGNAKAEQENPARKSEVPTAPTVRQLLNWLPTDTETILVSRGPFEIEPIDKEAPEDIKLDKALNRFALGPLSMFAQGAYLKILKGLPVAVALEGARGFRATQGGLGLMPYDGCHIIVLQRDLGPARDNLLKSLKGDAEKVEAIAKQEVFRFREKQEDDLWTFFITQPKPNIVLAATDRKYLEEVLKRMAMKDKAKGRALPEELPEWKHIDMKSRFWAIRHFDKANAAKDPSSPLVKERRSWNQSDLQAVGLVFTFDPAKENVARVKYLSGNERAPQIAAQAWSHPEEELSPEVRQKVKGVVEISVDVKGQKTSGTFLLLLLGALGHGIYF